MLNQSIFAAGIKDMRASRFHSQFVRPTMMSCKQFGVHFSRVKKLSMSHLHGRIPDISKHSSNSSSNWKKLIDRCLILALEYFMEAPRNFLQYLIREQLIT